MSSVLTCLLSAAALVAVASCAVADAVPPDFPSFKVPGHEREMDTLRRLYWHHYPASGPKATMWDAWLPSPSLWPAVATDNMSDKMRQDWDRVLSSRIIDSDGYVATHQHASIAHQLGWPFPFWNQSPNTAGWHFSFKDTVGPPWRPNDLSSTSDWKLTGVTDAGLKDDGWLLTLDSADASIETKAKAFPSVESPFIQVRWSFTGASLCQPYLEWTTEESPRYSPENRIYTTAPGDKITYTMIPCYKHPGWKGRITSLRLNFGNEKPGGSVTVQALFNQYDTRHTINSQSYVRGCIRAFCWTRDYAMLRSQINRMRQALQYVMTEHQTLERNIVYTDWVGHDGRSGLEIKPDGSKVIHYGRGTGNNYWDILPFGGQDLYATSMYHDAIVEMAALEQAILDHPEWNIPGGIFALDPRMLARHAAKVRQTADRVFWNPATGRFSGWIDIDGKKPDYGFTFVNLEAIYYGIASDSHAKQIMDWVDGKRIVKGDTSTGADIYHWRFAPRSSTLRNIECYNFGWSAPESIPFGGQVQDGGAILAWSYHDLMSRVKVLGPDSAWKRLQTILTWYEEVEAAGGYRKYYDGSREGSMQGGGTAGGLGLDMEFFESVLVPQIMIDGFMGFNPTPDGFQIDPRLPSDWPQLEITGVRLADMTLDIKATSNTITFTRASGKGSKQMALLPEGVWTLSSGGRTARLESTREKPVAIDFSAGSTIELTRS